MDSKMKNRTLWPASTALTTKAMAGCQGIANPVSNSEAAENIERETDVPKMCLQLEAETVGYYFLLR